MILKVYQNYIIKKFLFVTLKVSFVFLALIVIMSIFEEISFFSEIDVSGYLPIFLVILNSFSLLYEIFPFIFLIGVQFFFINLINSNELVAFKSYGLDNLKLLKLITLSSFFSGVFIVIFLYNFSAILKFKYIDLKNSYSDDSRYLASVTENGLWVKDEYQKQVYFINASKISLNKLYNIDIIILENDFSVTKKIFSPEANIEKKEWLMNNAIITNENGIVSKIDNYVFYSNFNYKKINELYSNLSTLTFLKLLKLRKDYKTLNYSVTDLNIHITSLYAYPFYLTAITILSSIIMINIRHQRPKIFYISAGILLSVLIYYISFFFIALGKNEQIPFMLSVCLPILLLIILSLIGMVKLNEK